jgi:hypothetical protein
MDSRYHGPCKANAFLSCQRSLPMSCISPPSYFHFPEKAVSVLGAYLRCWLSIAVVYSFCVFPVHLFRYFCGNLMQLAKLYKLKHLNKVEAVSSDNTGCSFVMGFDNLKNQRVAPPQWNMRTLDDRLVSFASDIVC